IYGPTVYLYGFMDGKYFFYPDHNHMWDRQIWNDPDGRRLLRNLKKLDIGYLIVDEGVYPLLTTPESRSAPFREFVRDHCVKVGEFEDRYYGRDWYNVLPGRPFKTEIYRIRS